MSYIIVRLGVSGGRTVAGLGCFFSTIFRRTALRGAIFAGTFPGMILTSRRAGFFRRHLRDAISSTRGPRSDYASPAKLSGPGGGGDGGAAVIGGGEQRAILAGGVFLLALRGDRRSVGFVGETFLLGGGTDLHSTLSAVEGHVRVVDDDRLVIDVGDVGDVYVGDGAVVEEVAFAPLATLEAVAAVAEAVVDAAVEADLRSPVAFVEGVDAVIPSPVAGSPEQAGLGSFHPGAGNPVVAVVVTPGPIAGGPEVAFAGADGLRVNRQRGRTEADGDADADLRGGRGRENSGNYR